MRQLHIAAFYELMGSSIMIVILVGWPIAVATAWYDYGYPPRAATFVLLAVGVLLLVPTTPMSGLVRSIIVRIAVLAVLGAICYLAMGQTVVTQAMPWPDAIDLAEIMTAWIAVGGASALLALLAFRLLRDECVDRVLVREAQVNLVVELVCIDERLKEIGNFIEWSNGAPVVEILRRLTEAHLLLQKHAWYPSDLDGTERRLVEKNMQGLSGELFALRRQLLLAKRETVGQLRERTRWVARAAYDGHFGEVVTGQGPVHVSAFARMRASIARLVADLPLALAPFVVILIYDYVGLGSSEYQAPRAALIVAGAAFATYVVLRALDPSLPGKVTLANRFLSILKIWGSVAADGGNEKDKATSPGGDEAVSDDS